MKRAMNAFFEVVDRMAEVNREVQADIEAWVAEHLLGQVNIFRWHLLYRPDDELIEDEEEYWVAAMVGEEFHTGLPRFLEWEAMAFWGSVRRAMDDLIAVGEE